jgi:YD repeat-containing protein
LIFAQGPEVRGGRESAERLAAKPSPDSRMERPRNEKPVLSPELEARLLELAQSPIPRAVKPGETVNADGSTDVYGMAEDGRKFYRHFDPRGELTKEGWNDDPGGEEVHRTYYETGQLKTMYWNRRDGSKTSIGFTLAGLYEYRWDKTPDGTEISTDYDDAGQVKSVWRRAQGGKPVRE